MLISFITVNYHSDEDTLSLITDLEKNELPQGVEIKVIAVDNSRSESFRSQIKRHPVAEYVDPDELFAMTR